MSIKRLVKLKMDKRIEDLRKRIGKLTDAVDLPTAKQRNDELTASIEEFNTFMTGSVAYERDRANNAERQVNELVGQVGELVELGESLVGERMTLLTQRTVNNMFTDALKEGKLNAVQLVNESKQRRLRRLARPCNAAIRFHGQERSADMPSPVVGVAPATEQHNGGVSQDDDSSASAVVGVAPAPEQHNGGAPQDDDSSASAVVGVAPAPEQHNGGAPQDDDSSGSAVVGVAPAPEQHKGGAHQDNGSSASAVLGVVPSPQPNGEGSQDDGSSASAVVGVAPAPEHNGGSLNRGSGGATEVAVSTATGPPYTAADKKEKGKRSRNGGSHGGR